MIEREEYCIDAPTQIATDRAALNRVAMMILKASHRDLREQCARVERPG
jgi:DNA-binding FrmR family transcriptional regulator